MPMNRWIQKAIKKRGALRTYIKRKYGKKGFTKKGTVKREILEKEAEKSGKTGKRARLAMTLRKLRK